MRHLGVFIQTLYDLGRLDELEKHGRTKGSSCSAGLQSVLQQSETHAHLVVSAARSYWQHSNNKKFANRKFDLAAKVAPSGPCCKERGSERS